MKVEIEVTKEELTNLIVTAVEGGIRYWARVRGYQPDKGIVRVWDVEGNGTEWHLVNRPAMLRGMQVAAVKYPHQFSKWLADRTGDAESADVFLQCAIFGDIIYG